MDNNICMLLTFKEYETPYGKILLYYYFKSVST